MKYSHIEYYTAYYSTRSSSNSHVHHLISNTLALTCNNRDSDSVLRCFRYILIHSSGDWHSVPELQIIPRFLQDWPFCNESLSFPLGLSNSSHSMSHCPLGKIVFCLTPEVKKKGNPRIHISFVPAAQLCITSRCNQWMWLILYPGCTCIQLNTSSVWCTEYKKVSHFEYIFEKFVTSPYHWLKETKQDALDGQKMDQSHNNNENTPF